MIGFRGIKQSIKVSMPLEIANAISKTLVPEILRISRGVKDSDTLTLVT